MKKLSLKLDMSKSYEKVLKKLFKINTDLEYITIYAMNFLDSSLSKLSE
jgi:hypothetical protein